MKNNNVNDSILTVCSLNEDFYRTIRVPEIFEEWTDKVILFLKNEYKYAWSSFNDHVYHFRENITIIHHERFSIVRGKGTKYLTRGKRKLRSFHVSGEVYIVPRIHWVTYTRRSLGKMAYTTFNTHEQIYTVPLVHELTHSIQYMMKKRPSETETTHNEFLFVQEHYPDLFSKTQHLI